MEQKPVLSIGMIFKNEARCLERCLKSLEPLRRAVPCELVMADTGSADGSRAVAARYADVLFDFPWADDFAAARNAVLERCSGAWHLQIDSDEWLDGDIRELVKFFQMPEQEAKKMDGCLLIIRNYTTKNFQEYGDTAIGRIMHRAPGRCYQGAIHEHWGFGRLNFCNLGHTILYHDGYVYADEAAKQAKLERNMVLLRKEYKKRPRDLLLLMQCIDSAVGEEALEFSREALRGVAEKFPAWEEFGPPIYRAAIESGMKERWPERDQWITQAWELFPQSFFTRIDINYYAVIRSMETLNFPTAIQRGKEYLEALAEYRSGRAQTKELFNSHLMCLSPLREVRVRINLARALCLLRRHQEAVETLDAADLSRLDGEALSVMADTLFLIHINSDLDVSGLARRLREEAVSVPEEVRRAVLRNIALRTTEDPEKLAELLRDVEDWGEVPVTALVHALNCGMDFPPADRRMNLEEMDAAAARLTEDKEVLYRLARSARTDTPRQLCWARALILAAVQAADWTNEEEGMPLARRFAEVEGKVLELCYSARVLNEENLFLLPPLHRFGFYCGKAFEALDGGDPAGCVRLLRAGLETNPAMKPMVEALLERTPELQAPPPPPELLALAEQVRTMLAAYGPEDPAVQAIKESPVYQRVAYLIEE